MITPENIQKAVSILRAGGLVAFPTETVYGLGADAANVRAVKKIFQAKGRPADHPLIVHIASANELDRWAGRVPEVARLLAAHFWPGPLTMVLERKKGVLDEITGGADTVGIRVPNQKDALALLTAFGGGIAAPSANRFGAVSPTTAADVIADLGKSVDMVLDGGPCAVGIESTIVDLSGLTPAILRPGGITREDLERVTGLEFPVRRGGPVKSPGQLPSHYAPSAYVDVCPEAELVARATKMRAAGLLVGLIAPHDIAGLDPTVRRLLITDDAARLAHDLYAAMRRADQETLDVVLVLLPDEHGLGLAVADRLRRAAGPRARQPAFDRPGGGGT